MSIVPTVAAGAGPSAYEQDLLQRLWTTKAVRFAASRRLTELDAASRLGIAILSLYVIAVTVVDLLARDGGAEPYEKLFGFVGIIAPVLILILEAHEGGKRHGVKADRMHRSAQQIQALHDRLERAIKLGTVTGDILETIDDEYQTILLEFAEHQDDLDYDVIRADYPQRFPNKPPVTPGKRLWTHFKRFLSVWGVPLFLIVGGGSAIYIAARLLMQHP